MFDLKRFIAQAGYLLIAQRKCLESDKKHIKSVFLSAVIQQKLSAMKAFLTILLLVLSNTFMTFAWYGHLKFKEMRWFENLGLIGVVLVSWGIALFEYFFQVPANRIGYKENGGPFSLVELKVIQEAITLLVFVLFTLVFFKNETIKWNHLLGFVFIILAVYFIFKK